MRAIHFCSAVALAFTSATPLVAAQAAVQATSPDLQPQAVIVSGCVQDNGSGQYTLANLAPVPGEEYAMKGTVDNPSSSTIVTEPSGALTPSSSPAAQPSGAAIASNPGGATTSGSASPGAATSATMTSGTAAPATATTSTPAPGATAAAPPSAAASGVGATGTGTESAVTTTPGTATNPTGATAGPDVTGGAAAMSPMTPTSSIATAVQAAQYTVAGVGPETAAVDVPRAPLASSYLVNNPADLKAYRGKRVQVVGVVLRPDIARTGGASNTAANGAQMQVESVRVLGRCKAK